MPGNIIKINNAEDLQWYVGDSRMDKLVKFLDKIGHKYHNELKIKNKK